MAVSELDAIIGFMAIVLMIYMFLWKRSKIIAAGTLFFTCLMLLIPYGGTDFEGMAWIAIFTAFVILVFEFAFTKIRSLSGRGTDG